jgi:hypothetical protein
MEMASSPRTVEEIFKDYDARRTAVVRALTHGTLISSNSYLGLFFFLYFNFKVLTFFVFFFCPFSQMLMNFTDFVIQVKCISGSEFVFVLR